MTDFYISWFEKVNHFFRYSVEQDFVLHSTISSSYNYLSFTFFFYVRFDYKNFDPFMKLNIIAPLNMLIVS